MTEEKKCLHCESKNLGEPVKEIDAEGEQVIYTVFCNDCSEIVDMWSFGGIFAQLDIEEPLPRPDFQLKPQPKPKSTASKRKLQKKRSKKGRKR